MPRNKVSYKPVRYVSRKKAYTSSYSRKQYRGKEANLQVNQNYSENKGQTSEMPEYPINNIVALPQNSDALNNVIRQNQQDFSYKKYLRRKAKGRSNTYCRNTPDTNCDVKPDINEIKFKTLNNFNVNRHTFILSDSEDDISFEETMNNKNINKNSHSLLRENVDNKAEKNDERSSSADDDVILVENEAANDIIEIDDNMEQDIPEVNDNTGECNALVSTPESSTSNDFLENSQLNQNPKFNFSLHGSEFKDSEFLIPTINVDISESGSISSISDISNSLKTNVFNLVDFPKEKDNLFDENNLEKFKNSITPQRHIENSVIADHSNFMGKADIYSKKQLPTLSDIGTDHKTHKRVRGRSVIRELVNDRAYILLSSAEKKMKAKKRKVKDGISNSLNDTDLTEITSPETSKKKKRKKMKKKEVSLTGETDDCENCENMIRTDSFSGVHANTHDKSENTNGGVILEKSETTFKQKQKKHQLVQVVDTNDVRKRSKKDRLFSGNSEKEECEQIILKKSDKAGKKNIQHKNEEQIELKDQVNTSLIERKRKRRKEQRLSEGEVVDGADGEISIEVSSISKRKPKKKRLSENYETENCQPTEVESTDCEVNIETSEKYIRQKTYSNTENASEVLHIQENSPPLTNLDESSFITCTEHGQKVDETELYIIECKPMEKEANNITQISSIKHTSDVVESSPLLDLVESNIDIGDHKPINKLDFVKNYSEPITYNETPSLADKNSTDSKESIRNMLRDIESPKQMLDAVQSTTSVSSEDNFKSSIDKNNCINQNLDKSCATAETAYAVCKLSETLTAGDKLLNKKLEENEVLHSTEDNGVNLSQIATSFTCKEENTEIVSLPTQVKMENLCDTTLHVNNQTNVVHVDEKNRNSELLQIEKDVINLVVKNEPQELESISCKEKQEFKVGSTESNLPIVSVEQECDFSISEVKEKLPDVIEKIISKKDPITSMRTLCEYLEEVNDPLDVLKKVSMIKEAFLAKSVDTEVDSPSIIEEVVSEDDVHSVSSDGSSVLCIESDSSDIDLIDNFTLINCESSTPVKEVGKSNRGFEKHTFVSNKSCSDTDKNITKDKDICNDKRRHETRSLLHSREAGNHERGLDKYDVEGIQQFMSDDQKLWEISAEDLPHKQFVPKGKRCVKCKEIGHLGYNCPNKSNLPKCILCGVAGHLDFKCPNRICTQCGRKSSIMKSTCQYCKHYRSSTCSLCKMRGHPRNKCPDLWRRYHLTEEQERPLNTEGMNLNEKENQQHSDAVSIEQSCSLIRKNTNFLEDRTLVEQCLEVNNQNESSLLMDTLEGENKVDHTSNYSCDSEKKDETHEFNCTKLQPLIHTLQEGALEKFAPSSSNELIGDVPRVENEIFVEVHSELEKEPNQLEEKSCAFKKESTQFEETDNTNNRKDGKSDSSKFIQTTELTENTNASSFNFTLNSKCNVTSKNIHFDSNILELFHASEQSQKENLKFSIECELKLLNNIRFDIKSIFYAFFAYKEDEKKPSCERKFPLQKVQTFNKTLNMVLFGRAHFKEGYVHYKRLEDFVNGSLPSKFVGKSLQYSYEYLFGATRHADVNYLSLIKLLLKQQTTEKAVIFELAKGKHCSTNSEAINPNANLTKLKTPGLKIGSSKKAEVWKDQTRNDYCDNIKNRVSDDSVFDFDADLPFYHQRDTLITRPEIGISQEVEVIDIATLNSNNDKKGLSAANYSKDQTNELLRSIDLLPPSDLIDVTAAPNQFGELKCVTKSNTSVPDSVISSTNSEFASKTSILPNSKLDSKKAESLENKPVDSDCDIHDLFIKSDIEFLKKLINDDLELLRTTRFKVKQLFHRFIAFKKDESNPISERKIAISKVQILNKTLNMMFFGKAHFKEGGVHYRKLVAFVNGGINSISLRESLFNSYAYVFSDTRHANVNYMALFKLLLKSHQVIPAEKEIPKTIKKTQHLKNSKIKPRSKNNAKKAKKKKRNSVVSESSKCVKETGQPKKSKTKTLKSVLESRFKNETSYSNFDPQEFFIKSETDVLCNFVRNELDLLQNSTFKVKKLFHQLVAYKRMEKTSSNISLCHQQILNVKLNMMLFGRAHLEAGGIHHRILLDFVGGVTTSNCTRESLYCSFRYIFGETRHDGLNYVSLIELLMKTLKKRGKKGHRNSCYTF
ncbi:hypothetical protein WA026_012985 [Henosepilachna vigintioctopunctata]|uniref:Zinc finger CCHC domain-containing protein 7 n=1 Tax=Henosepilachna vigintioctopunctata TaxID=420089 RepID=A0AAW1TSI2_9CUCU